MMEEDESGLRQQAVKRFLAGENVTAIVRSLGRTRPWLYKWVKRFQSGDAEWFADRARVPREPGHRIDPATEQMVVQIRTRLQRTPYAQIGPNAINWQLYKVGHSPLPTSTISAIVKRHGLAETKRPREPKGKAYPALPA